MKIVAICGSPRRGNSFSALQSIQENFPEVDFEILMLNELDLKMCRGCYVCFLKGEQFCPLKDDRDMIINKISMYLSSRHPHLSLLYNHLEFEQLFH